MRACTLIGEVPCHWSECTLTARKRKGKTMAEGVVARNLPSALPDNPNIQVAARRGRYAETIVDQLMPWRAKMAEEGSYFTARNPTVGTAVVSAISTSYSDTASFLFILQNTDQPSNPAGKSI